jgi:hypothetical protein
MAAVRVTGRSWCRYATSVVRVHGLDQDHPGQPNAPGRQALSQLAQRELDVPHLQVNELDVADQPDQVPGHDPVALYGVFCLRVQGFQPVLQAVLDRVIGGCADACGKFGVPGAHSHCCCSISEQCPAELRCSSHPDGYAVVHDRR